MTAVKATYARQLTNGFCWLGEHGIPLEADVVQFGDTLTVVFTEESLKAMADFDIDELQGAEEAIERAFWESEQAECARVRSAQQRGDQEFFDARAKREGEAA